MTIKIEKMELFVIDLPMTKSFTVSFGTVSSRRLILVKLIDRDGVIGWGEATPTDSPTYKPEFPETILAVIQHVMWPALVKAHAFSSPQEFDDHFNFIRGHYFAKSAMSMAAYDIAAQKAGKNLAQYIGGTQEAVSLSRTIAIVPTIDAMLVEANTFVQAGYRDLKLKIAAGFDLDFTKALRKTYPDLPLMVDANAGYHWNAESRELFHKLDKFNLFCIEQPLEWNDLCDHAALQSEIKTPIALDESIDCLHDMEQALTLSSCRMVNIKVPRVGGLTSAKRIYDLCVKKEMGIWVGGMIEGPIGLAAVMAFSTLPGFTHPADYIDPHYLIVDYLDYFEQQPYVLKNGKAYPSFSPQGLGLSINYKKLCRSPLAHTTLDGL